MKSASVVLALALCLQALAIKNSDSHRHKDNGSCANYVGTWKNKAASPGYAVTRMADGEVIEKEFDHTLIVEAFGPDGCLVSGTNTWTNRATGATATEGFAGYAVGSHLRFLEEDPGAAVVATVEMDLDPDNENVAHWGLIGALDPEYVFSESMVVYRQYQDGENYN